MSGFSSNDQIINAMSQGQMWRQDWAKNFNPTTAAVGNEFHTLFRGNGNPGPDAIFNAGTNLVFQPVTDATTNAATIQHGGNVSPAYKALSSLSAFTAAAGTAPVMMVLVDVLGFYRVTSVTTATAQATTNTLAVLSTFTAVAATDVCTHSNINIMDGSKVQLTTSGTLPAGLSTSTNYWIHKITDTTFNLCSSYANWLSNTIIDITDTGTGTHNVVGLLPRYTNGAGVQAIIFNSNATALGAATPNMSLVYTNTQGVGSRATPAVLPVGKTAASNSHIIYTGATGAGKYNYQMPLQSGDAGIQSIESIQNATSYASGEYTVALIKEITRIPLTTLGVAGERDLVNQLPSLPRIYDGAALYWLVGSSTTTPTNSAFSGSLNFIWN